MEDVRSMQARNVSVIAITAAAVALLALTMGSRSVVGLLLSPLNSATGLGMATLSFAVALSQLTWGAAQPFCGMLAERYGAARIIFAGTLIGALTLALVPFAHGALVLCAVFAVSGIAATVGSPSLLVGTVSQRVSPERRDEADAETPVVLNAAAWSQVSSAPARRSGSWCSRPRRKSSSR